MNWKMVVQRSAFVFCLILGLSAQKSIAQTTTQAEADRTSFARQIELAHSVIEDIKANRLCIQSTDFAALPDSLRAKFEDMVESQLVAQNRPFDPGVLTRAQIQLAIEANGDIGLELKRIDGEAHIWKYVSPAPAGSVPPPEILRAIEEDQKKIADK